MENLSEFLNNKQLNKLDDLIHELVSESTLDFNPDKPLDQTQILAKSLKKFISLIHDELG